ncbi:MAG: hypothetical protein MPJ24_02335 [Pirellulaceae bacterium]|nr:hypothetical protein [Pirellulaceae bacterium]
MARQTTLHALSPWILATSLAASVLVLVVSATPSLVTANPHKDKNKKTTQSAPLHKTSIDDKSAKSSGQPASVAKSTNTSPFASVAKVDGLFQPTVNEFMKEGKITEGVAAFTEFVKANPDDDNALFALGFLQVMEAANNACHKFYKYQPRDGTTTFAQIPIISNDKPEEIDYAKFRDIFIELHDQLQAADETLKKVDDPEVKLPLNLSVIRLEYDGDPKAHKLENIFYIYRTISGDDQLTNKKDGLIVHFDYGDVYWLRGYINFFMGTSDCLLAYDIEELFEAYSGGFFKNALSKGVVEPEKGSELDNWRMYRSFLALVYLVGNTHELNDAKYMQSAHEHFLTTLRCSHEMWNLYRDETDNDREWIPALDQTSVVSEQTFDREAIETWQEGLEEIRLTLEGERIVPSLWTNTRTRDAHKEHLGLNLKTIFTEPEDINIILWIDGYIPEKFVKKGYFPNVDVFDRVNRAFGRGGLIGNIFWVN